VNWPEAALSQEESLANNDPETHVADMQLVVPVAASTVNCLVLVSEVQTVVVEE
jgi:hypothetical protein